MRARRHRRGTLTRIAQWRCTFTTIELRTLRVQASGQRDLICSALATRYSTLEDSIRFRILLHRLKGVATELVTLLLHALNRIGSESNHNGSFRQPRRIQISCQSGNVFDTGLRPADHCSKASLAKLTVEAGQFHRCS